MNPPRGPRIRKGGGGGTWGAGWDDVLFVWVFVSGMVVWSCLVLWHESAQKIVRDGLLRTALGIL